MGRFAEIHLHGDNFYIRYVGSCPNDSEGNAMLPALGIPVIDVTDLTPEPTQGQYIDYDKKTGTWTTIQDEPFVALPAAQIGNREFVALLLGVGLSKAGVVALMASTDPDIALVVEGLRSQLTYSRDDQLLQDALGAAVTASLMTQQQRDDIEAAWPTLS